jgi:hypothetical protein
MVEVGTGTAGTRFLKTDWPIEEGLEAGTEKQTGRKTQLEPEENLSPQKEREGL